MNGTKRLMLLAALLGALGAPCQAQDVNVVAQRAALRFGLGPHTQLLVQPPQRLAEQPGASESGVGVEFKLRPARSSARDLQQLLRFELSQRSALQLKPRSGGLSITYREQF